MHEVDRDTQRRARRALGRPRLQHVEPSVLDREFDVLHVAKFPLELRQNGAQLGFDRRQRARQCLSGLRGVTARNDVLALRLEQHFDDARG
jgi:hypothetical protein